MFKSKKKILDTGPKVKKTKKDLYWRLEHNKVRTEDDDVVDLKRTNDEIQGLFDMTEKIN